MPATPRAEEGSKVLRGSIADVRIDDLLRLLAVRSQTGTLVIEAGGDEAAIHLVDGCVVAASGWAGTDPVGVVAQLRRMRVGTFRFDPTGPRETLATGLPVEELLERTDRLVARDSLRELRTRGLVSLATDPEEGAELLQELGAVNKPAGGNGTLASALHQAVAAQAAREQVEARVRASLRRR